MSGPGSRVRVRVIAGEHTGRVGLLLQANPTPGGVCLVELEGTWFLIKGNALAPVPETGPPGDAELDVPEVSTDEQHDDAGDGDA